MSLLASYGRSNSGFISKSIRCKVWPLILGIDKSTYTPIKIDSPAKDDELIIRHDSKRSFTSLKGIGEYITNYYQKELESLIKELLMRNPTMKYYQGLNYVAENFLLVLESPNALLAVEAVYKYYLKYLLS